MTSTIVALDLGTTHIRAFETEIRNNKPPKIKKFASVPLPADVISSGLIADEEALVKALKELWAKGKFNSKLVTGMVGGDALDTRLKTIDWVSEEDLPEMLTFAIKDDVILGDSDEFYYSAHTLDEKYINETVPEGQEPMSRPYKKDIFLTAAKRNYVDAFTRSVEAAGLRPVGMDALPLALIRATSQANDIPENANVVSIDIGADVVTIVAHKNLQPTYVASAPLLGGGRVTSEIADTLGVTLIEAELLKTSFSVPSDQHHLLTTTVIEEDGMVREISLENFDRIQKSEAADIISREVTNLVNHIGDNMEAAFPDTIPFRIILSGGGAGLYTLVGRVQAELAVPTVVLQPFEHYSGKLPDEVLANQHIFAALYGLVVGQNEIK